MKIKNERGASAGEYRWKPGESVEVDDAFAAQILGVKDAGFYVEGDDPPVASSHHEPRTGMVAQSPFPQDTAKTPRSVAKVEAEVDPIETLSEVDPAASETEAPKPAHAPRGRSSATK